MVQRLLLDTHGLLWVSEGGRKLASDTFDALNDVDNEVFVSSVSIWEIAIKLASGRLDPSPDLGIVLSAVERYGFYELSVNFRHAELAGSLPLHHRDPFDRMLVAQAQAEGLTLVTDDPQIARYEVSTMPAR